MECLSLRECQDVLAYIAQEIEHVGLMRLLQTSLQQTSGRVKEAISSWYHHLIAGHTFDSALPQMQPRFHPTLEAILHQAIRQGRLDLVVHDMMHRYHTISDDRQLEQAMHHLLSEYQALPESGAICRKCLLRELTKILQRAEIEQAYEVILRQEGEAFLYQTYLGVKAVQYREPSHSKVYATVHNTLTACAKQGACVCLNDREWSVTQVDAHHFRLSAQATHLTFTFKEEHEYASDVATKQDACSMRTS